MNRNARAFWSLIPACMFLVSPLLADDWPQWMGPQRDNVWRESGLIDRFPDEGPRVVWRTPIAGGYAGPAVANGRVYLTDYVTDQDVKVGNFERKTFTGTERVLCLDSTTGDLIWKHEYPVRYGISYPSGPRCTPNVDDDRVYTLGAEGQLICFDAASGSVIWSRDLPAQYNTNTPLWGYAAHPLIDGPRLISLVGGPGSHTVAFDKKTGREIWRTLTSTEQGYSPPTIIQAGGKRQLILAHPSGVASVDPETGEPYWETPYEASNGSLIMSPVRSSDLLFVGGFNNKNLLLRLSKTEPGAEVLWRDQFKKALSPVNVQPQVDDGFMVGFDQDGAMYGVDLKSGDRVWKSTDVLKSKRPPQSGTAFLIRQGDRYWLFNELGELIIARIDRDGYQEIDRAKVIEPTNRAFGRRVVWSAPAWASRRAYIRNDEECICVDLAQ